MAKVIKLKRKEKPYAVRWKNGEKEVQEAFDTRAEAELFRSQKNIDTAKDRKRKRPRKTGENPTFKAVAQSYLTVKEHPRRGDPIAPITLRVYESYLRERIYPAIGSVLIANVSRQHFEEVYDTCVLAGFSRKTRKETLRLITAVLKHAKACDYITEVPSHDIDTSPTNKEKIRERMERDEKTYTPDEVYTMLAAADSLAQDDKLQTRRVWARYRPMLYFLVYTGTRISEARGFPRKDFLPRDGVIKITQSAPEKGDVGYVKTADAVRDIPLHPILEEVLKEWLGDHSRILAFGTESDVPICGSNLYSRMLEPLKERADALAESKSDPRFVRVSRNRAFHAFRHHYASRLVKKGANLKELQTLMGHATAAITLDTYAHLFEGDQRELVTTLVI
ncbi:site-specific integrase [Loktanella sp. IMCC34160]|uniref:tyrosine-type recombinase/integrase n=1 Tax=Loktanella sp. IMCC34160 TaxID=2510646 RepID=UPI00101B9BC6|nr:site-specific integrase [Loktanella sp. IMCC34160]RYG89790.1 site-specific integrase [Loktanella sp. IMCC34160]